ncbi:MAG TPA: antibiotic biosynthesis monooxygenase [Gemmatimonadales bacterium]
MRTKRIAIAMALAAWRVAPAWAQDPLPLYPENYHVILENQNVRVLDFMLRKGAKETMHAHPAHVVYVVSGFRIRFTLVDGRTVVRETKAGDVLYSDAITHASENIGNGDAHGILVELKTAGAKAALRQAAGADLLTAVTFIQGRPATGPDVKRELLSLTAPTRAEVGNVRYDLYESVDRPDAFLRIEEWRDAEALETHKKTPHLRASFERRKNAGWMTEITRWRRVAEEVGE